MSKCPAEGKGSRIMSGLLSGRRLAAVLIVAALAVSCFVLMNDSNESEAVSYPNEVYVPNGYATTESDKILNGETKTYSGTEQARYENGTLTITDFIGTTYTGTHTENGVTAAIYANGDLTVVFAGDKTSYVLFNGSTASKSYGIHVNGDLTIINRVTIDAEVRFGESNVASTESAGIYCTGKLTIKNESDHAFTLITRGDHDNGNTIMSSAGIFCRDALTIQNNSNNQLVLESSGGLASTNGASKSAGIMSDGDLDIILKGNGIDFDLSSTDNSSWGYGIYSTGNVSIINDSGTTVDRTVNFSPGTASTRSVGVRCAESFIVDNESSRTLTIKSNANLDKRYALESADGSPELILKGSTSGMSFVGTDTHVNSCGFSAYGDLTVKNDSSTSSDRTVSFESGIAFKKSAGLYSSGSLTLTNGSTHAFTVQAIGADSGYDDSYSSTGSGGFQTIGVMATNGMSIGNGVTLQADGGDVGSCTETGLTMSIGILSGTITTPDFTGRDMTISAGARVTANGGTINNAIAQDSDVTARVYQTISAGVCCRSLTVNGPDAETVILDAQGGDIRTSHSSVSVGAGGKSYGINAESLTIEGGKVLSDGGQISFRYAGGESDSFGLFLKLNLTVEQNGTLISNAKQAWHKSYGMYVDSMTVRGGSVTGTADYVAATGSVQESAGIYCYGEMECVGGTVEGNGGVTCLELLLPAGINVGTLDLSGGAEVTGIGGNGMRTYNESVFGLTGGGIKNTAGIVIRGASHSVTGDGTTLTGIGGDMSTDPTTGANAGGTYGIWFNSNEGTITITGTGTINATGGSTNYNPFHAQDQDNLESIGLRADTAMIVSGTVINATGGTVCTKKQANSQIAYNGSISRGMSVASDLTLSNGACINAVGGDNGSYSDNAQDQYKPYYNDSYGLYVNGDISVTSSTINASTGNASRQIALYLRGSMEVEGETSRIVAESKATVGNVRVMVDGKNISNSSYGIFVGDTGEVEGITVTDGTVVAKTGGIYGIAAGNNNHSLNAGILYRHSDSVDGTINSTSTTISAMGGYTVIVATSHKFTVTYDSNGGTGSMNPKTDHIGNLNLPSCGFTKPGMNFAGWAMGSPSGEVKQAGNRVQILGDTTFYATWEEATYTVTWMTQDGSEALETDTGVTYLSDPSYGEAEPSKPDTDQYDYEFAGWATEPDKTSGTPEDELPDVTGDVTYYAAFSVAVKQYTATFDLNGGSVASAPAGWTLSEDVYTKDFDFGTSKADIISDFGEYSKVGHTKKAEIVDVDTMGTDGMTITANWSINKYTATFDLNGGSVALAPSGWSLSGDVYTKDFEYGTSKGAIISDFGSFAWTGHELDSVTSTVETMGTAGMALTANWTTLQYDANFNLSGGTVASTPEGWEWDDEISCYAKPFPFGTPLSDILDDFGEYTRVGYNKGAETSTADTMEVGGIMITAHWTPIKYRVDLNLDGGAFADAPDGWDIILGSYCKSFDYDTPYVTIIETIVHNSVATAPAKEGYIFSGWSPNTGNLTTDPAVLTAQYSVNKYTAIFDLSGGSVASDPEGWSLSGDVYTKDFNFGTSAETIISNFGGYTRTGFDRDTEETSADTMGISGMMITAKWLEHALTVTFMGNGSTGGEMSQQVIKYSDAVKNLASNAFVKTRYHFTEWKTVPLGSGTSYANERNMADLITSPNGTLTLYAQWAENSKFTVTFDSNEGSAVESQLVYDGEYAERPTAPEKVNFVFAGWYTDDGTFANAFVFETTPIISDIELYAKWDNHEHQLEFHAAVAPTCTQDGNVAYWQCTQCGTCFSDSEGTHELASIVDPATGHEWGAWTVTVQPTCTAKGTETRYCENDHSHTESQDIDMIPHTLAAVGYQEATCTGPGHNAHWVCSVCGKLFSDSEGHVEIAASDVVIPALGHDLVPYGAQEATCTEPGWDAYDECSRCDYTTYHEIAALGHAYSATYAWSADGKTCTVHIICARDAGHNHDVPVTATSVKKTDATFSAMGVTTYSVSGTYDSFAYADSIDIADIPYAAKEEGGAKTYEDTVPANTATDVTGLFDAAKEANGSVEVITNTSAGALTIAFDDAAVSAIGAATGVTLKANVIENSSELPDAKLVIEVTLAGATFSDGKAKVSIPFSQTVPEGKEIKVYFINGSERTDMNATLVDGKVVFDTNHFSTYAVFFEDSSSSSGGSSGGFPIWVIFVIIAVVAAAGVGAFFVVKNKKA